MEIYKTKYNDLKICMNKCVHHGIKCMRCFMNPIIGYRYKCSKCKNYNLCEICEEKNEISEEYPHYFIKIAKEKEGSDINFNMPNNNKSNNDNILNKNNINNNTMNNIINNNLIINNNNKISIFPDNNSVDNEVRKKIYLYECLNASQLSTEIYQGTQEARIDIILKNNGKEKWPKNKAKLIIDKYSSHLYSDDIILEPQKPGEQKKYCAIFKRISKFSACEYKSYLSFYVNNELFGEKLALTIKIKKKSKK